MLEVSYNKLTNGYCTTFLARSSQIST